MEPITRWFVQNKVAANMMMIFIIIAGFVTIPYIKMEVFPAIEEIPTFPVILTVIG